MNPSSKRSRDVLVAALLGLLSISAVHAQIFVANYYTGTIGEYNATTGATINASLVPVVPPVFPNFPGKPTGIAISGNDLFVANYTSPTSSIGEYNATTGAAINATLVSSGLDAPFAIALSGNDLFVVNHGNDTIGEYDATTGLRSTPP